MRLRAEAHGERDLGQRRLGIRQQRFRVFDALMEEVSQRGLAGNFRYLGMIPLDHVYALNRAAATSRQPSLIEPFGQALLEGMAASRSVVATRVGGPPEFVSPEAGVLVDPLDTYALAEAMTRAAELPSPNPAARAAAAKHDVRRQAEKVEQILERAARDRPA